MSKPLANRIALVTGTSRGIGAATALELARLGAHVVAVARTVGGLEELDDQIRAAGGSATLVPLDVRDYGGMAKLAETLQERYGRVDIVIGNAAMLGDSAPLAHIEPKVWDETLATNLSANFHLIRYMDGLLRQSDAGRLVMMTSEAGSTAPAYRVPYASTKAALDVMVRCYAAETANTPMRVNLFAPGPIRTRMRAAYMPGEDPMTLQTPDKAAAKLVELCMPDFVRTGTLYNFRTKTFQDFLAT